MKKDTITITREEYEYLQQRCQYLWEENDRLEEELAEATSYGGRMEDENAALKARIAELEAKNNNIKDDYFKLHDYALELEERETHLENLLKHARDEKRSAESRADLAEMYLDRTLDAIGDALEGARIGGDYEGNMKALSEVVQRYKI